MRFYRPAAALAFGMAAVLLHAPGAAAQAFLCTEATAGQLSCQAGVACECRYAQASAMDGTPAAWRWDCGILRARCGAPSPATISDPSAALPDGLSITDQSVIVNTDQRIEWIAPEITF